MPRTAQQLARHLTDSELVARTGMFTTYSGHYDGAHVTVVSGGSGSPEAELVLHEFLENTAATAYLRLGGSGGMHESVRPGDVVISHGVVRDEVMTQAYVRPSFPAAASPEIVLALAQAGEELGARYHVGITRSSDSDFCGVGRPSVGGYMQPEHLEVIDYYRRAGVLSGDRESAALVTLPLLFGRRGGSICSVADNLVTDLQRGRRSRHRPTDGPARPCDPVAHGPREGGGRPDALDAVAADIAAARTPTITATGCRNRNGTYGHATRIPIRCSVILKFGFSAGT